MKYNKAIMLKLINEHRDLHDELKKIKKEMGLEKKIIPTSEIKPQIKYQAHVQDIGWQDWVYDGAEAGTTGQNKKVEAIRIKLEGLKGKKKEKRNKQENKNKMIKK